MYNWSTDEKELKKDPERYEIWRMEQLINFGLNGEKINGEILMKHWKRLTLDPARKRFLSMLLFYGNKDS